MQGINKITAIVHPSNLIGASESMAYELRCRIEFDAAWFSKTLQRKRSPIGINIIAIKNLIYDVTGIHSMPYIQNRKDWKRAKDGIKTIYVSLYMDRAAASRLQAEYTLYNPNENLIQVNFKTKKLVNI